MDVHQPLQLLAGLSAQQFMRRHWQKKPLLVRQAIPRFRCEPDRRALFALAGHDDVESRLVTAGEAPGRGAWKL
ncbi:MAG: cupin domain-containing protein, partial [Burkholderiaceae bacterium]